MSNQGYAAGLPVGTDVIYTSRESALAANARAIGINAAAVPIRTEIAERGPARASDGYQVFKAYLAKAYDAPHGLEKSEPVVVVEAKSETRKISETERVTGPASVTDLIKAAHGNAMNVEDLERGYGGREQADLAKAAARPREVTASNIERTSPELRAAAEDLAEMTRRFDAMKQRQTNRRSV